MKTVVALTALVTLSLAACETAGPGNSAQAFCSIAQPIYLGKADKLTDQTARAIIGQNEIGARLCGWKPPAGK